MITIAKHKDELGEIKVLKHRAKGSLFYVQGGCYQTETDGYGISLASYIHAIFGLLAQAKARDVLMIGCAGGSLGTMLTKASMPITIVDKNPTSFQIAREYFGLSGTVDCHVADGREFLRASPRRYDAIVLDAYDGDNIPPHLRTLEFLELVESRLDQSRGCLFANIQVMHDLDRAADIYAAAARLTWNNVRLLDTRGVIGRNALVLAGNVRGLQKPDLLMPPQWDHEEIALDLGYMEFRARHS